MLHTFSEHLKLIIIHNHAHCHGSRALLTISRTERWNCSHRGPNDAPILRAFHGHINTGMAWWTSEFHTSPRHTVASPQKHVPKGTNLSLSWDTIVYLFQWLWRIQYQISTGTIFEIRYFQPFILHRTQQMIVFGIPWIPLQRFKFATCSHVAPDHRCPYGHDLPVHVVVQRRGHSGTPEDRCINSPMILISCE